MLYQGVEFILTLIKGNFFESRAQKFAEFYSGGYFLVKTIESFQVENQSIWTP